MSKYKIEITKFTLVGLVNTGLTFVIFFFLLNQFYVDYIIALTITWLFGIFFSFLLNSFWVFTPDSKSHFKARFIKYFLCYLSSFVLNLLALIFLVKYLDLAPFFTQVALVPFVVIFNFLTSKFWSLREEVGT